MYADAIELLVDRLRTALQIEMHLTLAFEHALRLGVKCRHELLRLSEPKPKVGRAGLLIALDASNLSLRHLTRPQFRHQFHPPHQLRRQANPLPVSPEPTPITSAPPTIWMLSNDLATG
jgi:hypothetical protein